MEELKEACYEFLLTIKKNIKKTKDMDILTEIHDRLEEFKNDYFEE